MKFWIEGQEVEVEKGHAADPPDAEHCGAPVGRDTVIIRCFLSIRGLPTPRRVSGRWLSKRMRFC